jgi:hypothetical protein
MAPPLQPPPRPVRSSAAIGWRTPWIFCKRHWRAGQCRRASSRRRAQKKKSRSTRWPERASTWASPCRRRMATARPGRSPRTPPFSARNRSRPGCTRRRPAARPGREAHRLDRRRHGRRRRPGRTGRAGGARLAVRRSGGASLKSSPSRLMSARGRWYAPGRERAAAGSGRQRRAAARHRASPQTAGATVLVLAPDPRSVPQKSRLCRAASH